jgi:hypothetical protein
MDYSARVSQQRRHSHPADTVNSVPNRKERPNQLPPPTLPPPSRWQLRLTPPCRPRLVLLNHHRKRRRRPRQRRRPHQLRHMPRPAADAREAHGPRPVAAGHQKEWWGWVRAAHAHARAHTADTATAGVI